MYYNVLIRERMFNYGKNKKYKQWWKKKQQELAT